MVIVINNDFSVAKIEPSTVYQGSDNATTLYVFAPFSTSIYSSIAVNFELPNGDYKGPCVLFAAAEQPSEDTGFGCWSMKLPWEVTQYSGTLKASLEFCTGTIAKNEETGEDEVTVVAKQNTAKANINISATVPHLSQKPSENIYQQILAYLSSIANKFKSGVQRGIPIYGISSEKNKIYLQGIYKNISQNSKVQIMKDGVIPGWNATIESIGEELFGFSNKTTLTLSEALPDDISEGLVNDTDIYLIFPDEPTKGNNINLASYSLSFGTGTEPRTFAASTFGTKTRSDAPNQLAGGTYNAPAPDSLFVMGNGESEDKRSNAGGLRKSGRYWQQSAPEKDDELVRLGDMNLKAIESIKFDADGKLVITLNNGDKFTMNSGWLTDVSNGGSVPPTAQAVQTYVNQKASEAETAAKNHADTKVSAVETAINTEIKPKAIGIPVFDETTGVIKFSSIDGTNAKEINLLLESEFDGGYYDADTEELVIKFKSGNTLRLPASALLCPTWVSDIEKISDEQKATPPTAEAVREYVDETVTKKVPFTANDAGKEVSIGPDGNLIALEAGKYVHTVYFKSNADSLVNAYVVLETTSPEPMSWEEMYRNVLEPTMYGEKTCNGTYGEYKITDYAYTETAMGGGTYDTYVSFKYLNEDGSYSYVNVDIADLTYEDVVLDNLDTLKNDVAKNKSDIAKNKSDIEAITRRVDNLEDVLVEERVETSEEYMTPVPANVGRHALLNEVGGMTHRVEKVLRSFGDGESLTGWGVGDTSPLSDAFSINVKPPFFLVADEIYGDIGFYVCDANNTNFFEPLDNSRLEGNGEARYNTECEKYTLYQYSGEGGAFGYKNLRLCTYELQTSIPTAIESRGKNLIPFPYPELGGIGASVTENGVTATVNEDGGISLTGTADNSGNGAVYFTLCYMKGLGETFYGKSWLDLNGGSNGTCYFSPRVMYDSGSEGVMVFIKDGEILNETIYPQIEYGTIGTEYASYREPITYTLPEAITSKEEYGLGIVYKDKVYSNTIDFENKKYYPNRAGKFILNGSENWLKPSQSDLYQLDLIVSHNFKIIISNHYKSLTSDEFSNQSINGVYLGYYNTYTILYVRDLTVSSLTDFKDKLKKWAENDNPLQVVCAFDDNTAEDIDVDDVIEVEPEGTLVALNNDRTGAYTKVSYIIAKGGSAE